MKSAHVAVFTIPQPVHVNPTLSTVRALIRRGHRVTYVTSQRYSAEVTALGANVALCPRLEFPWNQISGDDSMPMAQQYASGVLNLAERTHRATAPLFAENKPDLILFDTHSFAGILLAEELGVPSVRVTSHLRQDEEETFSTGIVRDFFRTHGIVKDCVPLTTSQQTFYLFDERLQLGDHDQADPHDYAPRCAAERPYIPAMEGNDEMGHNHILVSCSTYYVQGSDYFSMCMEAIRMVQRPGLLAPSVQTDLSMLENLPSNCKIVRDVPLLELMKFADVLVCQGGTATTMEALYHGLPMVMVSNGHKQLEMYANNVERHGLGMHIKKCDSTASKVAECIKQCAEPAIMSNVQEMKRLVVAGKGGEDIAAQLEKYL